MATVLIQKRRRRSRNSYIVYFKDPMSHKSKYFKTFQRQKDAQQAAYDLRALIDAGNTPEIKRKKSKLTLLDFREVACSLRKEWTLRLGRKDLRQKTYDEYSIRLNLLSRTFGKMLLCKISREDIENYINNVSSSYSNVTANRSLSIIKKVFEHGINLKAVINNPSQNMRFLSEKEHERNRFLLPKELDKLIAATRYVRGKYYLPALIYLGAEHGASKQEALSLKWKDIDFDYAGRGLIRLFRTKNNKERTEYLMPRTKEALLSWRDHQEWMRHRKKTENSGSNLVFCRLNGTPVKRFDKAWRTLCKTADIDNFHYHDLRHTFCSNLILSGSGLKEVKDMIGHNDISMTDRYSHLTFRHRLIKQEKLAEHYRIGE